MLNEELLAVHSLHFDRGDADSGAIPLWDPVTETRLGEQPEWIRGRRSEPVAYARGARPSVSICLLANHFVPAAFELSAFGPPPSPVDGPSAPVRWLGPHPVSLERKSGWTTLPETVPFNRPLPQQIGRHSLELQWFAEWTDAHDGAARRLFLGQTQHEVCVTGATPTGCLPGAPPTGVWAPVARWSSRWCAGQERRKELCDALLRGLPETGLQYGIPAWSVRHMLTAGGGMCGAWYQLFQQLADCQGVAVEGRTFRLAPGEPTPTGEVRWEAMVSVAPGINRVEPSRHIRLTGRFQDCPTDPASTEGPVELLSRHEHRYCYPAGWNDGHCINFLEDGGRLWLYDPCFRNEAVALDMPLPPTDGVPVTLEARHGFRRDYLHAAMPWLMGTLRANGRLWPVDLRRGEFGITVKTEQVAELAIVWTH